MRRTCPECHGTGQLCYFKGESRFVLSRDECPACCGLGFLETDDPDDIPSTRDDSPRQPEPPSPPEEKR